MASPGNQHCANCIGTLLFSMHHCLNCFKIASLSLSLFVIILHAPDWSWSSIDRPTQELAATGPTSLSFPCLL